MMKKAFMIFWGMLLLAVLCSCGRKSVATIVEDTPSIVQDTSQDNETVPQQSAETDIEYGEDMDED